MKKLNRKGFTLVELLAVIIILAIVVGITIPAVLTTISNTRKKAFQSAADEVANWIDRQYQALLIDDNSPDAMIKVDSDFNTCVGGSASASSCSVSDNLLAAAGVKPVNFNITNSTITINTATGRSCVCLQGKVAGDYQTDKYAKGGIGSCCTGVTLID